MMILKDIYVECLLICKGSALKVSDYEDNLLYIFIAMIL